MTGLWFDRGGGHLIAEKDCLGLLASSWKRLASSFSMSDQYAREYVRAGMAHLHESAAARTASLRFKELNRAAMRTSVTGREHLSVRRGVLRIPNGIDYRRGRSYWVL